MPMTGTTVFRWPVWVVIAVGIVGTTFLYLVGTPVNLVPTSTQYKGKWKTSMATPPVDSLPLELLELGIYTEQDFVNDHNVRPPFWDKPINSHNTSAITLQPTTSTELQLPPSWGPCFEPPKKPRHWKLPPNNDTRLRYPSSTQTLQGTCRPGFLIIGAGKCGTSSLYHYLVDHPRVLPAKQKQIHYFKYYPNRPLRWYYSFFPETTSFLERGGLLTGEASPGYLPYPDVPHLVYKRLPGVRIITLGRNPIERMYSSYEYNYIRPTVEEMRKGRVAHVPKNREEAYYRTNFLFTFEEMIVAELDWLRQCLDPTTGSAVVQAQRKWSKFHWARQEMDRRKQQNLPPLADLDGLCYGNRINSQVLREQWKNLQTNQPDKIILDRNIHLVQSFIGRSLYVLPLEWWYARFDATKDLYFVCTEELSDVTGQGVARVASFLGLPRFNFSPVVQKGAYNVGGHQGYDKEVSWEVVVNETHHSSISKSIPLSEQVLAEVQAFIQPYNERLFALVDKQCSGW